MWFWMNSRWTAGVMLSAAFFGGTVIHALSFSPVDLFLFLFLFLFLKKPTEEALNQNTSTATAS